MRHAGLRAPPFSRAPPSHGVWWLVVGGVEGMEDGEMIRRVFGIGC
jgi:hypothetical protein